MARSRERYRFCSLTLVQGISQAATAFRRDCESNGVIRVSFVAAEEKKAEQWMRVLPGAGYVSVAVLYITTGLLAGLAALGRRGETPDVRAAVRALWSQPFGPALLLVIAAGSICLVVWRLLQAFADIEGKGSTVIGLAQRARYFAGSLFYLGVPLLVFRMFLGTPGRSGEQFARTAVSKVIALPFGWTIVVAIGIGFLSSGSWCFFRMIRGRFEGWFHLDQMAGWERTICFALGRLGYAARGAILVVMGYFVIIAGWNLNPRVIEGQAGAMRAIFHQPFGPLLLGMVSVGLIAFGGFSLLVSRYGKVPVQRARQLVAWARKLQTACRRHARGFTSMPTRHMSSQNSSFGARDLSSPRI